DQLSAARLGWGVFQQSFDNCSVFMGIHNPFQFFTSTHDSSNVQDYSNFDAQLQSDVLPAFSLIIPDSKHDMHPSNSPIGNGITFLQTLVQQVQGSPAWNSTAIIVTFDTGGGWYDHVFPPALDDQGLAFRVPALEKGSTTSSSGTSAQNGSTATPSENRSNSGAQAGNSGFDSGL